MERMKEKILIEVARSPKSFWELLQHSDFLLKDFLKALEDLHSSGLIENRKGKIALTAKGKKFIDKASLDFSPMLCEKCLGKRIILDKKLKEVLKLYKRIVRERPSPTKTFFQGYMQESDVIARVAFMHYNNDLNQKKILLIGDDDLVSIALALTRLPSRVLVLDIDERIGNFIEDVSKRYKLGIEFQKYNVADPLPKKLLGKFDVFSSEPLETLTGLKAFLLRGICSLKKNSAGYFGLTHAEASLEKWLKIEKFLTRMNCVITDLIAGFSIYPTVYGEVSYEEFAKKLKFEIPRNPGINWYKSSLFRFEVLEKPKYSALNKRVKIEFVDKKEDITFPS